MISVHLALFNFKLLAWAQSATWSNSTFLLWTLHAGITVGRPISGADSIGHGGTCPHFYKWLGTGAPWVEEQQTRNWPTVLTITKALTKTTNCAFRAKKWSGMTIKKNFPALCAGSVPPTFKFVLAPLVTAKDFVAGYQKGHKTHILLVICIQCYINSMRMKHS